MSDHDKRTAAIIASVSQQIRDLLSKHLKDAEQCAADADLDGDKPPKACMRFIVRWAAGARTPRIAVNLSYGSPRKGGSDELVDPDQQVLDFGKEAVTARAQPK